ncbi:hypothetical protein HZI31_22630 [Serratia fonticola]|uniref:hypothetical protein n=1 Tax=Serratia fonticola TaxID=47917 RepID=UPI0015C58F6C|nr:hypothetical protein [Serratia fonticola]NYA46082.1 hypothetical protein [Serratia fonticola]
MMLTQKVIRQEIEELRAVMGSDSLTIPSMWECAKPGVLILLWMFICPLIAFSVSGSGLESTLFAVGFSSFIGVIMLFGVMNARGFILAIPKSFREKSKVVTVFKKKIKVYALVYMILNMAFCVLVVFWGVKVLLYAMVMIFLTVGFVFFFNADVSRYQLSAFTEIVKAFKAQ